MTPFEKQTGCQTNVKVGDTSDEMVDLMRTGQYDGVSASGNATARLVDGGDVAPVNVDLVPNYKTIFDDLKDQPYNTFDGTHYGIPHGRGANLLMWNTDDVKPDPTSWSVILDPNQAKKYKGKISVYDDPIYIADAAVYLKAHQPDLGIDEPVRAERGAVQRRGRPAQAAASVRRRVLVQRLKQITCSPTVTIVVGTTWQYQYFTLLADNQPVQGPWADTGVRPRRRARPGGRTPG